MRALLPILALLLSAGVLAQPPSVLPGDGLGTGGIVPDTTAPWRYYPLHVGDRWEYSGWHYAHGQVVIRRDILGDTTIEGQSYFIWRELTYQDGSIVAVVPPKHIRYDTTSTFVFQRTTQGERQFGYAPCPFDTEFGGIADCDPNMTGINMYAVSGGYDGAVVLGGNPPDTIYTPVKYYRDQGFTVDYTYGAGLGEVYSESDLRTYWLQYARIDGVEYGAPLLTVGAEPDGPEASPEGVRASAFPNPFQDRLTVALHIGRPQALTVGVYDVLGRQVLTHTLGLRGAGRHTAMLNTATLAPGLYVVRVHGSRGGRVTQSLVKAD